MSQKTAILFLMLLISSALSNVAVTQSAQGVEENSSFLRADIHGANVLFDEAHHDRGTDMWTPGNVSTYGWILVQHGFNVSTNFNESLDSGILSDYDVLCLFFPQIALTTGEVQAVHDFVDAGGALLLVGVDTRPTVCNYTNAFLNPISETYGISFNADSILGVAVKASGHITEHQITTDVDSFTSSCDLLQGCSLTISSPATSIATIRGSDALAYVDTSGGRVVAINSPATFFQYWVERGWLSDPLDHFELSLNIMDWLVENDRRTVTLPDEMVLTVGDGPDLNSTELDQYTMVVGAIHDHTTYSDGSNAPIEMLTRAVEVGLDYFVMSDHSYSTDAVNGIHGAQATRALQQTYGLDISIIVGAELSSIPHTVGFPLTEQVITADTQEAVDGIHAQGGIAILAHPTLSQAYIGIWENLDFYGYDAFEVINKNFFHGLGEEAFTRPFVGASDGHNIGYVGRTLNAIFIKDPSGPNGTVTGDDITEAILARQVVVLNRDNQLVLGEQVWVDRYLEIREEADTAIEDAEGAITDAEEASKSVNLAKEFLQEAMTALEYGSLTRAITLAEDAMSEYILGIDVVLSYSETGIMLPGDDFSLTMTLTNTLSTSVSMNCTPYLRTETAAFAEASTTLSAASESTGSSEFTGTMPEYGFAFSRIYINDYNSPYPIEPVTLRVGGIVDNVTVEEEEVDGGTQLNFELKLHRGEVSYISSVILEYDNGSGLQTVVMSSYTDAYQVSLGPYPSGYNITYRVIVTDDLGHVYELEDRTIANIGTGLSIDFGLVIVIIGASVAVIAIVYIFMKRR